MIDANTMTPLQLATLQVINRRALAHNATASWGVAERGRVLRSAAEMAAAGLISIEEAAAWVIRDGQDTQ